MITLGSPRFSSETGAAWPPPVPVKDLLTPILEFFPEGTANKVPRAILHEREHHVNITENNLLFNFLFLMFRVCIF